MPVFLVARPSPNPVYPANPPAYAPGGIGPTKCGGSIEQCLLQAAASDADRPHHLVVLMGQDVAMPHIEPQDVKARLDPGYAPGVDEHRVLESGLVGIR